MPLRVAIAGAGGRMGQALIEATLAANDLALVAALDVAKSPALTFDAGEQIGRSTGIRIAHDVDAALSGADVLIDFTRPQGTLAHLALCRELGVAAVVGTTGFDAAQKAEIASHAAHIAIVMAPNMSVGVNVVLKLLDVAARSLAEGFDVVLADTAGRLHTKTDLMQELEKVRRVVAKASPGAPHETWLVIDSTSGQNAIAQAQIFTQAMQVTGIVLTKLDGTAKGGVILGIADQLKLPVRYIGVGERVDSSPFRTVGAAGWTNGFTPRFAN